MEQGAAEQIRRSVRPGGCTAEGCDCLCRNVSRNERAKGIKRESEELSYSPQEENAISFLVSQQRNGSGPTEPAVPELYNEQRVPCL
ncbi:unnamed protein product [Gadus morhua 'NCC']